MARNKADTTRHLSPRTHAAIVLTGLIVFSLAAARAYQHSLSGWEYDLFHAIYSLPDTLTPLFLAITQLGSGWMALVLVLVALIQRVRGLALKLLVNGFVTLVVVEYAKLFIARPRPVGLDSSVTQRELFVGGYGFPSGHTAMATVLGLTLLPYVPRRYYWIVLLGILLVGLSRIYLGVHAPLDVIGGLALGLIIASLQHTWSTTKAHRKRLKKRVKRLKLKAEV